MKKLVFSTLLVSVILFSLASISTAQVSGGSFQNCPFALCQVPLPPGWELVSSCTIEPGTNGQAYSCFVFGKGTPNGGRQLCRFPLCQPAGT